MCGIVGMLIKNPAHARPAGRVDDADADARWRRAGRSRPGMAVFTEELPESERKYSVYAPSWDYNWARFEAEFIKRFGTDAALGGER